MTPARTPDELARLARGMTKAQQNALHTDLRTAAWVTIKSLQKRKLVSIRPCRPDGKGIVLTPLGLALRDWFAGQELAGLLAHASGEAPKEAPAQAYVLADAMLAHRKGTPDAN